MLTVQSIAPIVQNIALTVQNIAPTVQSIVLTVQSIALTVQSIVLTVQSIALTVQTSPLTVQTTLLTVQSPSQMYKFSTNISPKRQPVYDKIKQALLKWGIGLQTYSRKIVEHPLFQPIVIGIILLNAIFVGIETYGSLYEKYREWFLTFDIIVLILFTIEIILKMIAEEKTLHFFKDNWNVFDFLIVAASYVFIGSPFITVLRILRVLRVFRTISVIPSLRKLVNALLMTLPSLGTIMLLLFIVFYIFSVIGTMLFQDVSAEYFGNLQLTALTLFQMITLESWASGVMRPVMEVTSWAWIYFVAFILVGAFVVLNLFVGVIVNNFEKIDAWEKEEEDEADQQIVRGEIAELRQEIRELKELIKEKN